MKKKICLILACAMVLGLCIVAGAENDLANTISLPKALILGHTYDMQFAQAQLSVNGQACQGSFVAEGSQMVLDYTAGEGQPVVSYTLPVVDTQNSTDHCSYLFDAAGKTAKAENENDITLSFSGDASVAYLTKLSAEDVAIYFSCVEGATNYESVSFTLTDAANAMVSLTFTVDMEAKTVAQGDQKAELESLDDVIQLRYKSSGSKLTLGNDRELFVCREDDQGESFSGFAGGVYLSIFANKVSGASQLRLTRIGNHPLGHKNSTSPDMVEPMIRITENLPSTLKINQQFTIPGYEVYDALSPIVESGVKVEAPDGTVYTQPFTVTQYGKYKLTCTAKDSHGNQAQSIKMIYVNDDIAPELTVTAMEKTEYKLGETVSVPGYTATDNLDSVLVDVILFLPNGEIRLLTHEAAGEKVYCLSDATLYSATFIADNSSFRTEQTGTYTLRYVAYDDQYNRVTQELTFTVK